MKKRKSNEFQYSNGGIAEAGSKGSFALYGGKRPRGGDDRNKTTNPASAMKQPESKGRELTSNAGKNNRTCRTLSASKTLGLQNSIPHQPQ